MLSEAEQRLHQGEYEQCKNGVRLQKDSLERIPGRSIDIFNVGHWLAQEHPVNIVSQMLRLRCLRLDSWWALYAPPP